MYNCTLWKIDYWIVANTYRTFFLEIFSSLEMSAGYVLNLPFVKISILKSLNIVVICLFDGLYQGFFTGDHWLP